MGLPGKPKGFDGGEVERYFHEGKIKEIGLLRDRRGRHLPSTAALRTVLRHAKRKCVRGEPAERR
jgi:hypothetical protein